MVSVTVKAIDTADNGVDGVDVEWSQNGTVEDSGTTGPGGEVELSVPSGSYTLTAIKDNYWDGSSSGSVSGGETVNVLMLYKAQLNIPSGSGTIQQTPAVGVGPGGEVLPVATEYTLRKLLEVQRGGGALSFLEDTVITGPPDIQRVAPFDTSDTRIDPATTALEAALKSNDTDEFVSRITDSTGAEINPATQALEAALASNGTDEFISRITGSGGTQISESELGTAVTGTDVGLVTYLSAALSSVGNDEVRTDIQNSAIKVPTDIQDALEKSTINYGLDLTSAQSVKLQIDGYSTVEVFVSADSSTTIDVDYSYDDTNFENYKQVSSTSFQDVIETGAKYIRIETASAGSGGDLVDIVIMAKP